MRSFDTIFSTGLGLLGCVAVPIFVLAFVVGAFRWTTGPMLQAAGDARRTRTFLLTDLIWLLLQMQLAMAVCSYAFPAAMPASSRAIAMILLSVPVVLFWLASLQAVSRAGIQQPLRRAAVFVILLPGFALTILGIPLLTIGLFHALAPRHEDGLPSHSPLVLGVQLALLLAFAAALRWLARWTVAPT